MLYPLKQITNNTIDQVACTCLRTMAPINKQSLSCAISLMQFLTKKKKKENCSDNHTQQSVVVTEISQ